MSEKKIRIPIERRLKPCPFCGSTRVRVMYSDINKAHVVYCTNCKASTNIAVREEDAIYLWNKRVEPEVRTEYVAVELDGLKSKTVG